MNLIWIFHKYLKFNVPQIKIYDQISTISIIHAFLHKSAALPALSISVSGITTHPATKLEIIKSGLIFTFSTPFPTN